MEKKLKNDEIEDVDEKQQGQEVTSLMYVMDKKKNDTPTAKPPPGTENMQSSGSSNHPGPAVNYENKFRQSVWNKDQYDDGKPLSFNYLNINPFLHRTGPESILHPLDLSKFSCHSKGGVAEGTPVKLRKTSSAPISAAKLPYEDDSYPSNRKMKKVEDPSGKITKENVSFPKVEDEDSDIEVLPYPGSPVSHKNESFSDEEQHAKPEVQLLKKTSPDEKESDSDIEVLPYPGSPVSQKNESFSDEDQHAEPEVQLLEKASPDKKESDSDIEVLPYPGSPVSQKNEFFSDEDQHGEPEVKLLEKTSPGEKESESDFEVLPYPGSPISENKENCSNEIQNVGPDVQFYEKKSLKLGFVPPEEKESLTMGDLVGPEALNEEESSDGSDFEFVSFPDD